MKNTSSDNSAHERTDYEKTVFVSYAWEEESEKTVQQLEKIFSERKITILRDKNVVKYKDPIKEFEARIGRGECIILVVSDKYLRSEHCMNELLEIDKNREFLLRVFPVILESAQIYDANYIFSCLEYWQKKYRDIDKKKIGIRVSTENIKLNLKLLEEILEKFDPLVGILRDRNNNYGENFSALVAAVELQLARSYEKQVLQSEISQYKSLITQIAEKNSVLQITINQSNAEIEAAEKQKGELLKAIEKFNETISQMTDERKDLQNRINILGGELDRVTSERNDLNVKFLESNSKVGELTESRDQLVDQVFNLNIRIGYLLKERESSNKLAVEAADQIKILQAQWSAFQTRADKLEKKIDQMENENQALKDALAASQKYFGLSYRQLFRELSKSKTNIKSSDIADKNVRIFVEALPDGKANLLQFYWIFSRWIDYGISATDAGKHPEVATALKKLIDYGLVRQERREHQVFFVNTDIGKTFLLQLRTTGDAALPENIILG